MMSRMRLYITFDQTWISQLDSPSSQLRAALDVGLESFDEYCMSYEQYDDVVIIEVISERDVEAMVYIIAESFSEHFPSLDDSNFDIEIDLNVPLEVIDWDQYLNY